MRTALTFLALAMFCGNPIPAGAENEPALPRSNAPCKAETEFWFSSQRNMNALVKKWVDERPEMDIEDKKFFRSGNTVLFCVYFREKRPDVPPKKWDSPLTELA